MFGKHYVLVTKGSCPYCKKAIELLKSKELEFIYTDMENAPMVLEVTKASSGYSTVPMIWEITVEQERQLPVESKFIGGFEDLSNYLGEVKKEDE
jgi:glutaredoxin 3